MKNTLFTTIQPIARVVALIMATICQLSFSKDHLYGRCNIDCHGITRVLPTTFCCQLDSFRAANTTIVVTKNKMHTRNTLILYGSPGTGKSTLAEIFAKQSVGVRPVILSAPNLVTVEQGSGAANINAVFETAKRSSTPTVIIIEEIDSIANVSGSTLNKNEDRRAAYQALNTQIDSIENNHKIFVICTTNYIEKCAPEFLSRFEHIEIGPLSEEEHSNALKTLLFNNDDLIVDTQIIHHIMEQLIQKASPDHKESLQAMGETFGKVEESLQKISLAHYDSHAMSNIKTYKDSIKRTIAVYNNNPACEASQAEQEIATLTLIITLWEMRLNVYDFVMKPNDTFNYLTRQTKNTSLRFIKYFSRDIIIHAQQYQSGCITKELLTTRLEKANKHFKSYRNDTNTAYEVWQDELLRLHRAMLVSQITIQGASAAGSLTIQGITHGNEVVQAAKTAYDIASAHSYTAAGISVIVAVGTVYGGYKIYKWVKGDTKKDDSDKPGH